MVRARAKKRVEKSLDPAGKSACATLVWRGFWPLILICSGFAQTVIRVPVRLVSAPALVFTADGQLIPDLKAADFRLYDNDRPQKVSVERALAPISFAVAVQTSMNVRSYVPFIAKVGSVVEALLVGETGESALLAYNSDVKVLKPFDKGDLQQALRGISPGGLRARSIDAGVAAIELLKERPPERTRVLLFIGQPMDDGSESTLASLQEAAEKANVTVFGLALPEIGKAFVSDTFTYEGQPRAGGGFKAGVDLSKLISVLGRTGDAAAGTDPFTTLAGATAGGLFRFRRQHELEGAIAAAGVQLHSGYVLTYYPSSDAAGRHAIRVEVNRPGVTVRTRHGYTM